MKLLFRVFFAVLLAVVSAGGRLAAEGEFGRFRPGQAGWGVTESGEAGPAIDAYNRGAACSQKKDFNCAITEFSNAIGIKPEFASAYLARGRMYLAQENYDAAITDFSRTISLKPSDLVESDAYFGRGVANNNIRQFDKALSDYSKALSLNPENKQAREFRKHTAANIKKIKAARQEAVNSAKNRVNAFVVRGDASYKEKNYSQAIEDWNKALEIDPGLHKDLAPLLVSAYGLRGTQSYLDGKYSGAIEDFDRVLRLDPSLAEIEKARGAAKEALAKQEKSKAEAARAAAAALQTAAPAVSAAVPQPNTGGYNYYYGGDGKKTEIYHAEYQKAAGSLEDVAVIVLLITGVCGFIIYKAIKNRDKFPIKTKFTGQFPAPVSGEYPPRESPGAWPPKAAAPRQAASWAYAHIKELMAEGEYEKAYTVFDLIPAGQVSEADKINLFEIQLRLDNYDSARLLLEEISVGGLLREDPKLRNRLIELCNKKGQADLARKLFRPKQPPAAPNWQPKAQSPAPAASRPATAGPAKAVEQPAAAPEPSFGSRVRKLIAAGNYIKALGAYSSRAPQQISEADRINLFELHLHLGDYDRAHRAFGEIQGSKVLTGNVDLYLELAGLCYEKNQNDLGHKLSRGVFEAMQKCVNIRDNPERYYQFSGICQRNGAVELAAEVRAAMKAKMDILNNPERCYDFARLCEKKGDLDMAVTVYRKFIETEQRGYQDVAVRYISVKDKLSRLGGPRQEAPRAAAVPVAPEPEPAAAKAVLFAPGTTLGDRYELRGDLGQGAMGMVYDAWDRKENRRVALKRMLAEIKDYPGGFEHFRGEEETLKRLKHPNIIRMTDAVKQGGELYIVFDYVEGETLDKLLKKKHGFSLEGCKKIFGDVCDAVHYAHKSGVIHRDLKPGNIMLTSAGKVMVMDFGLSSELPEGFTRLPRRTVAGSPAYMAPEQHDGIVKREADIYALGVSLYEMLTGTLPYKNMEQKKAKEYREVTALIPWLPSGVDSVISRALDPEPAMRFGDALDFWSALKDL